MKITIYTVSDCQFSKAEIEYLKSHNLPYQEKNLEQNREWLNEMLAVSNNFAGTPVTKIEKDDGQILVLKGFTQEEFDQVLSFKKEEPVVQASANVDVTPPTPPTSTQSSTNQPPSQTFPPPPQSPQTTTPPQPTTTPSPAPPLPQTSQTNPPSFENTTPQPNDPLASVLSDLEEKANLTTPTQPSSPPPTNIPNIPNFNE